MPELQKLVGENLRRIRLRRALSQEDLASRAGMDRAAIPLIESGSAIVTLPMVEKLAHALGVRAAIFFQTDDPPHADPVLPAHTGESADETRAGDLRLGRRLRSIRTQQGLSLEMLGHLLGVGAGELHRYEEGTERVPPVLLVRLATILNVHLSAFVRE